MQKLAMIVDDDAKVLRALARVLVRGGWKVMTFTNPKVALEYAKDSLFPLVIVDYRMPEMNGSEFLKAFDAIQPVAYKIMLSGEFDRSDIVNAMSQGRMHSFIHKPWDNEHLMKELESGLAYFKLLLKAEFLKNKESMTDDEFKRWNEGLIEKAKVRIVQS